jgi:alkanesulfonate monooxygenase SsuD/methylene tetrahydromethanopterin reductase-like flavin-dependent oxidoreductase (luciferase family)
VMACVNVLAAETDAEATFLTSSLINMFLGVITNERNPLRPPGTLPESYQIPEVQAMINNMLSCTFTGSRATLRQKLSEFIATTGINELMAASYIYDPEAKLRSFSILYDALHGG